MILRMREITIHVITSKLITHAVNYARGVRLLVSMMAVGRGSLSWIIIDLSISKIQLEVVVKNLSKSFQNLLRRCLLGNFLNPSWKLPWGLLG